MDSVLVSDAPPSPHELPQQHAPRRFVVDAVSRPLTEFSGDFYFSKVVGGDLWFALGDFAGHGLSAAVYSAMIQEELLFAIQSCSHVDPAEALAVLHSKVQPEFPFNRFASLVVGRLRPDDSLQLVNAGHCRPIIRRNDGKLEEIDSHGPVLGLLPRGRWVQGEMTLRHGDALLLHSDGLLDATDSSGSEVGAARLHEWIRASSSLSLRDDLLRHFDAFTCGRQSDDLTLMVVA